MPKLAAGVALIAITVGLAKAGAAAESSQVMVELRMLKFRQTVYHELIGEMPPADEVQDLSAVEAFFIAEAIKPKFNISSRRPSLLEQGKKVTYRRWTSEVFKALETEQAASDRGLWEDHRAAPLELSAKLTNTGKIRLTYRQLNGDESLPRTSHAINSGDTVLVLFDKSADDVYSGAMIKVTEVVLSD